MGPHIFSTQLVVLVPSMAYFSYYYYYYDDNKRLHNLSGNVLIKNTPFSKTFQLLLLSLFN